MQIELHGAFVWDCDNCGIENFERAKASELPEDMLEEMMDEAFDVDASVSMHFETNDAVTGEEDGELMSEYLVARVLIGPSFVTCKHCGSTFAAKIPAGGEDEE